MVSKKPIKKLTMKNGNASSEEFLNVLKLISPGSSFRSAIDGILAARKGGLIVLDNPKLNNLIDGGFRINARFTPQRMVELAKMDGAIVISSDLKKIVYANTTLYPDNKIKTKETGTRHKAGERTAKQTGGLVIAISERRNHITLYYKDIRYMLRSKAEMLRKAAETLQILEKQRELFETSLEQLNYLEIYNNLNIDQASDVIQKGLSMMKILESQEKTFIELGNEANATRLRIKELMNDVKKNVELVMKDYSAIGFKKSKNLLEGLEYEEIMDEENISLGLGQEKANKISSIKGYRIIEEIDLDKEDKTIIFNSFQDLQEILNSQKEKFEKILGEEKAIVLEKEINKIKTNH